VCIASARPASAIEAWLLPEPQDPATVARSRTRRSGGAKAKTKPPRADRGATAGVVMEIADAAYTEDKCRELTLADYSKEAQ
jgi:hypothetical protein